MHVLRVEIEAPTASFRYPHFMVGRHPTFPMPPPATLYGLVCAAVGDLLPPDSLQLGYGFTVQAEAHDLEHLHSISPKGGRTVFTFGGGRFPHNTDGTVTPTTRDFLFGAKLTLYLNRPELGGAFRCPHYALSLGRSQDLATVVSVAEVELEPEKRGYLEHTLLPAEERLWIGRGVVLTLPRFVDPMQDRAPHFAHYLLLRERVYAHQDADMELQETLGDQLARPLPADRILWTDPDSPEYHGLHRAVWLHGLV